MRCIFLTTSIFSLSLLISGCTTETDSAQVEENELTTDLAAQPQADWPVYSFGELVDSSELIAQVKMVSQTEEVKSEVTEHRDSEEGELHEHYIPLNVTEAQVIEVVKGDDNLEGEVISIKQLTDEKVLSEPASYIAFLEFAEEEDSYYSKGLNQHLEIIDDQVDSGIEGKEGDFAVEDFITSIESQLE